MLVSRIGVGKRPVARITTAPQTLCRGASFVANVSGDTSAAILWIPSVGVTCDTCATTSVTPDSTRVYLVRLRDRISGCTTYDTLRVTVNPLPVIDSLTPSQRLCQKQQIRLYAATGTRYVWTPATGLSDAAVQSPIASPTTTTTYTVRIYNAAGCWTEGSTTITVAPCGDSIKTDPQGGATPFIACDSADAPFGIRNLGQIAIQIDSVSVWRTSNATADVAFLAQQNAVRFPAVLQPNEDLNPAFRVRLIPAASGPFTVVFRVHTSNGTRIDTVRFSGTGTKEPVLFYLGQTSVAVDSSFIFPVFGESSAWSMLKIREVVASITFNPASMQFDTAKTVLPGDMLDGTWTVNYDKATSTAGTAVFRAVGTTPLSANGTLIKPSFKTLLGTELKFIPVLATSLPSLRVPCAEERTRNGFVNILSCVADLRRVALGAAQFSLVSIAPNPAESHSVDIRYSIGFDCDADIRLIDMNGRDVARLVYGPHQSGTFEARFDSTLLPAGEYLCVLSAAGQRFSAKLVIR
ncbi:MAG: T9SS type A sorting domain-containing protein [Candidatus Kapaibacterium sp.]